MKKGCSSSFFSANWARKLKFYVDLIGAVDWPFRGFSFSYHLLVLTVLTSSKCSLEEGGVPRITSRQIELGKLNLISRFSIGSRCAFWGFRLFRLIAPRHSPKNVVSWSVFLIESYLGKSRTRAVVHFLYTNLARIILSKVLNIPFDGLNYARLSYSLSLPSQTRKFFNPHNSNISQKFGYF